MDKPTLTGKDADRIAQLEQALAAKEAVLERFKHVHIGASEVCDTCGLDISHFIHARPK